MERRKLYSILSILVLIYGCNSHQEIGHEDRIDVANAIEVKKQHVLVDFIDSLELIPLESTVNNPIGYTQSIVENNRRFYVCDPRSGRLYVFDHNGNEIGCIDEKGKGPGEYLWLKAFDVDIYDNIYILAYKKIIKYDKNLKFVVEYDNKEKGQRRDVVKLGSLFCTVNGYLESADGVNPFITVFDSLSNNKLEYERTEMKDIGKKYIFKYKKSVNIIPPYYRNIITTIDMNAVVTNKIEILLPNADLKYTPPVLDQSKDEECRYNILKFIEMEKYYYIEYGGSPLKYALYLKTNNKCYRGSYSLTTEKGGIALPIYNISSDGKYLLGIMTADKILKYIPHLKTSKYLTQEQIGKLKNITIKDNPVVIKIRLK